MCPGRSAPKDGSLTPPQCSLAAHRCQGGCACHSHLESRHTSDGERGQQEGSKLGKEPKGETSLQVLLRAPSRALTSSPRGLLSGGPWLSNPLGFPGSDRCHRVQRLVYHVCPSSWIYWPLFWHPSSRARQVRPLFLNLHPPYCPDLLAKSGFPHSNQQNAMLPMAQIPSLPSLAT